LVCIEGYTGFKYKRFRQQGGSGWNGFGVQGVAEVWRRWGEQRFGEDGGSRGLEKMGGAWSSGG